MIDWSKVSSSGLVRACARLTLALCLVAFGFGGAVERKFSAHVGHDSATLLAVSASVSVDATGGDDGGEPMDHGCGDRDAAP